MYVFKDIDKASTTIEQNITNYTHNLTTSSLGIQSVNIASASISTSYWDSINTLFYSSASVKYPGENKFNSYAFTLAESDGLQYLYKFHGYPSSSIVTIPSTYYGEKIKEGSFTLIDKSFTDNDGNNPIIKDDKRGNLYSTNGNNNFGTLTASSAGANSSSISSSDNYIGNIFYDLGLVVLTETASWSGSIDYSDITKDTNFTLQFDSFNTIVTHEYSVTLKPNEFNHSMNYTLRQPLSGSYNTLEEFNSYPVVFILANEPKCCFDIAKKYIELNFTSEFK